MSLAPQNMPSQGLSAGAILEPSIVELPIETVDDTDVTIVENEDGSVTVSVDGRPVEAAPPKAKGWFDNLAEDLPAQVLGSVSEELLRGIHEDSESRREWVEDRANGLKLLGLKIEVPGLQGASDGAPVEGMSKVRHPLLLEAVLRFQANARAELLPAAGPVKVSNDDPAGSMEEDQQATALEKDLNHYLTTVATEFYPDTDRMLLNLGFGGTTFKKIYYCPLRMRPVSEAVDANDLIVSNDATDLTNAIRVTQRISMRPSVLKRMQILGAYRDIDLPDPQPLKVNEIDREQKAQQGIRVDVFNPEDRKRGLYECCCELDLPGYEHKINGEATGLQVPYCVTIDESSREILSITRNYNEETKDLPVARARFAVYTFVPGFGFYGIGLLHILGNTTNAVTAAWRIMLDNGMYANFPGFLISKDGSRQNTTILRVPPGGGAQIDTQGKPIGAAVMPLPYQTTGMPAMMSLTQDMVTTGQRVGGTSEVEVGEGRADVPVGTTLALIEQAIKVMDAVHKRLCASQACELQLIVECFKEHPESFVDRKTRRPSAQSWTVESFLAALNNPWLSPRADPNTSSTSQRLMKVMALKQLQAANPSLYNPLAIDTAALQAIGYSNPQQFFAPPEAQSQPPPELQQAQAKMANESKETNARAALSNAKAAEIQAKLQGGAGQGPGNAPDPAAILTAKARLMDAESRQKEVHLDAARAQVEDQNRDSDREAKENQAVLELIRSILTSHPQQTPQQATAEAKAAEASA